MSSGVIAVKAYPPATAVPDDFSFPHLAIHSFQPGVHTCGGTGRTPPERDYWLYSAYIIRVGKCIHFAISTVLALSWVFASVKSVQSFSIVTLANAHVASLPGTPK